MSKPLAGEPGYVCSLRAPFGFVAVLDREAGAEVPPVNGRWFVAAYDKGLMRLAVAPTKSQKDARTHMKDARTRGHAWLAPLLSQRDTWNGAMDADEAAQVPLALGEEYRTLRLDIGGRSEEFRLRFVDRVAQPSMPNNESYMRGWWNAKEARNR